MARAPPSDLHQSRMTAPAILSHHGTFELLAFLAVRQAVWEMLPELSHLRFWTFLLGDSVLVPTSARGALPLPPHRAILISSLFDSDLLLLLLERGSGLLKTDAGPGTQRGWGSRGRVVREPGSRKAQSALAWMQGGVPGGPERGHWLERREL